MNKKNYIVSAIVSVYNCERFIAGCLEDLEQQTIADKLEIVVVNSGSQQNEEAIIKKFQEKYKNIVYIKTVNRETIYQAWNRGIKAATGKYITNANSDDRHRKDAFEVMVNVLENDKDADLIYYDFIITEKENETFENCTPIGYLELAEFNQNRLLCGGLIGHQPMWRKSLHEKFGFFDGSFKVAGDHEFWLRISENCGFKHIKEYLGLYLRNKNSAERKYPEVTILEILKVRDKYMKRVIHDEKILESIKRRQSEGLCDVGYIYLEKEQFSLARKAFIRSLAFNWHNLASLKYLLVTFIPIKMAGVLRKAKAILSRRVFFYAKN